MENKLCDYGCGKESVFTLKNGKKCCSSSHSYCEGFKKKLSENLKNKYESGERKNWFQGKSWNKGKTKENDLTLAEVSRKVKEQYASGERKASFAGKHHTEEAKKKIGKNGGLKHGAGRGKNGWYKGFHCDSSWELAWVIYQIENNIVFKRNTDGFPYVYENIEHKYFPDFVLDDGTYVEIKGFLDGKSKEKIRQFPFKLKIILYKEMIPILDYVVGKYGSNFISLYENGARWKKQKQTQKLTNEEKKINKESKRNWGDLDEFKKDLLCLSWKEIEAKYEISANGARKRAKALGFAYNLKTPSKMKICKMCGKKTKTKDKDYCGKCYKPHLILEGKRPSVDQLNLEFKQFTYQELGEKYGVSWETVRSWRRKKF